MRCAVIPIAACFVIVSSGATADGPITPIIELQSEPLTPPLAMDDSRQPIHQIRLLVDTGGKRATLVLDPNVPEFDDFGQLVGGIQTPQTMGKGGHCPVWNCSASSRLPR
jgi:hypothetical protein